MKNLIFIILAILISSCSEKNQGDHITGHFVINGTLPSKQFDGTLVYLVPVIGDNPSNVDSTVIRDGKFTLEGDTERVSILRLGLMNRQKVQELLVVTEKGIITAKLDTNSIGSGTKQNVILQQWKDATIKNNIAYAQLQNAKQKGITGLGIDMFQQNVDKSAARLDSITESIKCSKYTTLSIFMFHITGMKWK